MANPSFDIPSTALFSFQTSGKRLGDPWFGQQSYFIMDVTMTEEHSSDIQVTEHPVEIGSDITDNARPKPDILTIEGFISETPFDATGSVFWGQYDPSNNGFETTKGYSFPTGLNSDFVPLGRAQAAFDLLRQLKDKSEPLSITTELHYYPTMLIESIRFPRDTGIGDSLKVSMKFRAVRFVNSETALVSVKSARDQSKTKKGPASAKPVDPTSIISTARRGTNKVGLTNEATKDQP